MFWCRRMKLRRRGGPEDFWFSRQPAGCLARRSGSAGEAAESAARPAPWRRLEDVKKVLTAGWPSLVRLRLIVDTARSTGARNLGESTTIR